MVTCFSFTTIVLFFVLLTNYNIVPTITNHILIQLFVMSFTIAIGMYLVSKLEEAKDISSLIFDVIMRVIICYAVVLIEGSIFGMITFGWNAILEISPVLLPTIIVTYILSFFTLMEFVDSINKTIKSKKERQK